MKATISNGETTGTVEVDGSEIVVTFDGATHRCEGFRPGMCAGEREQLAAALSFLGAAAESLAYHTRRREDPFEVDEDGDLRFPDSNVHLFPREVVEWTDRIGADYFALAENDLEEIAED